MNSIIYSALLLAEDWIIQSLWDNKEQWITIRSHATSSKVCPVTENHWLLAFISVRNMYKGYFVLTGVSYLVYDPGQNGCHFAENIFWCSFFNENVRSWIQISLKFIHNGPIDNKVALVWVMFGAKQTTSHYLNQCWLTVNKTIWYKFQWNFRRQVIT